MRLVLAIAALAASASAVQAGEDRYGPPRAAAVAVVTTGGYGAIAPSTAAPSSPYAGRMLSWSGKTVAPPPVSQAVAPRMPQAVPQPVATTTAPARGVVPRTYPSTARPLQTAAASPAPQAPLPTSLYDRPVAAPAARSVPAPQPQAQAAAVLPPSPSAPISGGKAGWAPPKYYSVHRQFGQTPDRIEIPPPTSYWVDRAGATAQSAGDTSAVASAPDDYPVGGVGNEPEEERPIKERIRTTNADGTVTTTTKRASQ